LTQVTVTVTVPVLETRFAESLRVYWNEVTPQKLGFGVYTILFLDIAVVITAVPHVH
jgi:hypothetical protein